MAREWQIGGRSGRGAAPVAMADLLGVWRRALLVTPEGRRDDTSDVYWLQSQTLCGDMRRETGGGGPSMKAFAGRLSERDGIFRWERTLASYPLDGDPDDGRLAWQGGDLREDGVHAPYWEIWTRVALPSSGDYAAELFDPQAARPGYLLSIGGFRFFGEGGSAPAFGLSGADGQGKRLALSTGDLDFDRIATLPAPTPGHEIRIGDRNWRVAAVERPDVFATVSERTRP